MEVKKLEIRLEDIHRLSDLIQWTSWELADALVISRFSNFINSSKVGKLNDPKLHREKYKSSIGIDWTYVPNMADKDKKKWKIKPINKRTDKPRVEIRKSTWNRNWPGWEFLMEVTDKLSRLSSNWDVKLDEKWFEEMILAVGASYNMLWVEFNLEGSKTDDLVDFSKKYSEIGKTTWRAKTDKRISELLPDELEDEFKWIPEIKIQRTDDVRIKLWRICAAWQFSITFRENMITIAVPWWPMLTKHHFQEMINLVPEYWYFIKVITKAVSFTKDHNTDTVLVKRINWIISSINKSSSTIQMREYIDQLKKLI